MIQDSSWLHTWFF